MAKKMGLGRGLSAILPDVEEVVESVDQVSETPAPVPADAVVELSVGDIDPNFKFLIMRRTSDLDDVIKRQSEVHPLEHLLQIRLGVLTERSGCQLAELRLIQANNHSLRLFKAAVGENRPKNGLNCVGNS